MVSLSSRIHGAEAQQVRLPGSKERSPALLRDLKLPPKSPGDSWIFMSSVAVNMNKVKATS